MGRIVRMVAVVVLGASAVAIAPAQPAWAFPPPVGRWAGEEIVVHTGELIRQKLAQRFAGYWLDEATGELTVGVTDPAQAAIVRALAGVPRIVPRNAEALDAVMARLNAPTAVPASVTGWYIDITTNTIVVTATGKGPAVDAFAGRGGEGVRIVEAKDVPQLLWNVIDGQAIYGATGRCSAGFNARTSSGTRYVITAGHCTALGGSWSGLGGTLGPVGGSSFPTNDYGIVRVTSTSAASTPLVDRYSGGGDVTVAGSVAVPVGARVCRSGSTTGWHCGVVQALNQTVSYGGGQIVSGLTRTNVCAEPGDSGGAFVSDPPALLGKVQAQGMTSGGSGSCTAGGITFFQPVNEALAAYGLTLYTG